SRITHRRWSTSEVGFLPNGLRITAVPVELGPEPAEKEGSSTNRPKLHLRPYGRSGKVVPSRPGLAATVASRRRSCRPSGAGRPERMMKRYAAVTDQTVRAAETVSANEVVNAGAAR